ncbi:MAG: hypothetical protein WCO19_04980 [Candidatus Saccharibacteria bacterium]
MYILASKDRNGDRYLDGGVKDWLASDWHKLVDHNEPIDCLDGEALIFDDAGNKYHVGSNKKLATRKLFWKVSIVDVGEWDYKNGEPFLIDLYEKSVDELKALLVHYVTRFKVSNPESLTVKELIKVAGSKS